MPDFIPDLISFPDHEMMVRDILSNCRLHGKGSEDMNNGDVDELLQSYQELTFEELLYLMQDSGPDLEEERKELAPVRLTFSVQVLERIEYYI